MSCQKSGHKFELKQQKMPAGTCQQKKEQSYSVWKVQEWQYLDD
jgi:hypothetical protein